MAALFYTSNPQDVYEYEWILGNPSFLPKVIRSPTFKPFPSSMASFASFYIQFQFENYVKVHLMQFSGPTQQFNVKSDIFVYEITDKLITSSYSPVLKFEQNCLLNELNCRRNCLPNDKLKVKGKLTFGGHKVISMINTVPALLPSSTD
ncbi:hypothetical protein HNY73_019964 [Argiope bruennichi]|uniref:Uncharacterized protein n=1 Tax=Argiope bruennichi TaxID=94029 RepID=A0A8T0E538_ARGBR|nr:hypothetical protein HNY73_019964 [Argiope bruennichi]